MAKTTERDLVDEVEELLAKATSGPWVWESVGEFDGEASSAGGFTYQHIRAGHLGVADTYHASGAQWPDGSVSPPRDGNVHDANLIAAAPELLRRLVEENKRIANAFLIAFDLAGIDAHPLPEALPESAYVDGYMDKVRELRAVFALIAARVKKENPDA